MMNGLFPRRLLPAFLIALALLLVAAGAWVVWQRLTPAVSLAEPARGKAVEAVYATGTVEPVRMSKVGPLVAARIVDIVRKDGDTVAKGELLARLDDREAAGNVANLVARRDFLRSDKARQESLVAKNFVSRSALDRVDADLRQAEAQLAAAQRPLAETALRAPLAGRVLRQDGEIGEMATAGQTLFWIGDPTPLRITADVDEEDILRVKPGQKTLIKADALPNQPIEGRIAEITEKGDPINKNYRVRIALPDDAPLKTGMTVEVNIVIRETPDAWLVPARAVSGGRLWVARDGRAAQIEVKAGVKGQDKTEILSGVSGGERVIVEPPAGLKAGDRIRER